MFALVRFMRLAPAPLQALSSKDFNVCTSRDRRRYVCGRIIHVFPDERSSIV